jgi:tRNA(adenine34) deaminase
VRQEGAVNWGARAYTGRGDVVDLLIKCHSPDGVLICHDRGAPETRGKSTLTFSRLNDRVLVQKRVDLDSLATWICDYNPLKSLRIFHSGDPDQTSGVSKPKALHHMTMPAHRLMERIVREIVVDEKFMEMALEEARRGASEGEVPVGAVLVKNGDIIGRDHNRCIQFNDPTAHAEILVIRKGGEVLGNYRLADTTLYVTVEPCPMCVGAITHGRIVRLVYGAPDDKTGAVSSRFTLLNDPRLNHRVEVKGGILRKECSHILQGFFKEKR